MHPILPDLFEAPIETAEVEPLLDPILELLPEEKNLLDRAAPERLLEFRAGRHCARVAMSQLGVSGPVLRSVDRAPIWPDGVVGSIAHTRDKGRGFCGAAVAEASAVRALGLDAEMDTPLEPKLFRRVLRAAEIDWISRLPDSERGHFAKLVFSAKESVYKCQYALSRTFLEFADVEIGPVDGTGSFSATLLRAAPPFSNGYIFVGRHVRREGILVTGVFVGS